MPGNGAIAPSFEGTGLSVETFVPAREGDIVLVGIVRNEMAMIGHLLDHHRGLGVDRLVIVDNGSDDGTADYLAAQDDVVLLSAPGSYRAARQGVDWVNAVLDRMAPGHWALVVDADEAFVYPECETLGVHALTTVLDQVAAEGVEALLLDMYGDGPIAGVEIDARHPLVVCPYFDADTYGPVEEHPLYRRVPVSGGPRRRLFWDGYARRIPPPFLGKVPLVHWRPGLAFEASTHILRGVATADLTGALLHFKLTASMARTALEEATRREHWNDGAEYAVYADVLTANPGLSAMCEDSRRYTGTAGLQQLGLLRTFPEYGPRVPAHRTGVNR